MSKKELTTQEKKNLTTEARRVEKQLMNTKSVELKYDIIINCNIEGVSEFCYAFFGKRKLIPHIETKEFAYLLCAIAGTNVNVDMIKKATESIFKSKKYKEQVLHNIIEVCAYSKDYYIKINNKFMLNADYISTVHEPGRN